MSAIKPIIREVKQSVLKGFAHAKDKLHQLADNLTEHIDDVARRVRGQDHFDNPNGNGGSGGNGPGNARPGFNADGSVNPDDFRTPRDGAYYWSGLWPRKGDEVAGNIAANNNATTLEMLLDARGIELPEWDDNNPAVVAVWTQVSEAYASGASGTVRAVLGDNIRPNAVWWAELDRLQANPNITEIIKVHPDTLVETPIWP
jgi:hypothetical protein